MEIQDTVKDGLSVLHISGRIWEESDTAALCGAVTQLTSRGHLKVVLDLGDVPLLNSSGLGALIAAFKFNRDAGGRLVLMRSSDRIQHLLHVTKLKCLLKNFASMDSAASYLNS